MEITETDIAQLNKKALLNGAEKPVPSPVSSVPGRLNNFDLIRLVAAVQVVFHHLFIYMDLTAKYPATTFFQRILLHFPGVPMFFTISGFLVYWSYDRNHSDLRKYFRNRALRIFPALWACLAVTVVLLAIFVPLGVSDFLKKEFWIYIAAQMTMGQIYFPTMFSNFGSGYPNGPLWTIPIELQFYMVIPVIYFLCKKIGKKSTENLRLGLLFIAAYGFTIYASTLDTTTWVGQLIRAFILPYLFNFLIGVFIYRNFGKVRHWFEGKFWYWLGAYFVYTLVAGETLSLYVSAYWPNFFGLIATVLLSLTVISAAFTKPSISHKLLKNNDISYGVYIYHMLVINTIISLQWEDNLWAVPLALCFTLLLAWLSWVLVEKRALRLK